MLQDKELAMRKVLGRNESNDRRPEMSVSSGNRKNIIYLEYNERNKMVEDEVPFLNPGLTAIF